jgi:c-di-GMP-binding flagellar brake protein YcgR
MPDDFNQNPDSTHFNYPVDEKTKLSLFKMLATTKTDVQIYKNQKKIESVTYPTSDINKVTVIYSNDATDESFKTVQDLTCHFSLYNEIYFFTSKVSFTDTAILFSVPVVIYKIQRRDNFRVSIPKNLTQLLELVGHKQLKVSLVDLSLGGCKVLIVYPDASYISNLKVDAEIALKMTFLSIENQTIHCKLKFIIDNATTKSASIGFEFANLKADEIKELQAAIFKIDRLNRQANLD